VRDDWQVESQIDKHLSTSTVSPSDVTVEKGDTFDCDVTWSNGADGKVIVTQEGGNQYTCNQYTYKGRSTRPRSTCHAPAPPNRVAWRAPACLAQNRPSSWARSTASLREREQVQLGSGKGGGPSGVRAHRLQDLSQLVDVGREPPEVGLSA
jgi:hypothetical protein